MSSTAAIPSVAADYHVRLCRFGIRVSLDPFDQCRVGSRVCAFDAEFPRLDFEHRHDDSLPGDNVPLCQLHRFGPSILRHARVL